MDDDLKPLEAGQFREALDRELTGVGATESARQRLRERLDVPAPVTRLARWAIPLATAAAVIAVAGVPVLLKDDPTPKPVVPGVSVPSVQPTPSPSKPLRTAEPLPTSTTSEAPAPSSAQPTPKVTTPPPTATPTLTQRVLPPPPATLSTIISPPPTAPPSVTASATTSQPSAASTP